METSVFANRKTKSVVEKVAQVIFTACAVLSVLSVISIMAYMIYAGTPALMSQGVFNVLFGTVWEPTAAEPSFGILKVIVTSIVGVTAAIIIGVPIGLLTAVHLAEIADKRVRNIVKSSVELLAGIPSVIYGLLGILLINPVMYNIERFLFNGDSSHQMTGGANLIAAVIVLAIMILPTLINISETALRQVPDDLRFSSLALGASQIQTIFKVVIPAGKNGIISAIVLGVGRAIGEAMAIVLVAGNSVNWPSPFNSVRFLTTAIVSEMSYSSGVHRQVLFTIGLVLFVFIILINLLLTYLIKRGDNDE